MACTKHTSTVLWERWEILCLVSLVLAQVQGKCKSLADTFEHTSNRLHKCAWGCPKFCIQTRYFSLPLPSLYLANRLATAWTLRNGASRCPEIGLEEALVEQSEAFTLSLYLLPCHRVHILQKVSGVYCQCLTGCYWRPATLGLTFIVW